MDLNFNSNKEKELGELSVMGMKKSGYRKGKGNREWQDASEPGRLGDSGRGDRYETKDGSKIKKRNLFARVATTDR